jgi:predicted Zn-dependent protease
MHLPTRLSILAFFAAALLGGCGTAMVNPVTGQTERSVMSEQAEIAEGAKAHQQVLEEYGVVKDARLQTYVNNIGQRLAKLSHRDQLQWHFTVLDSPEINAFALPGGYVYVTRGIMAYLQTEAELAGVIGHEIGHVTARHGAQRATRQQDAGLGVLAASVLGMVLESQGVTGAGRLASDVSQTAAAGYVASYGREQELQADGLGAEYLARSAFDPRNMIKVIGTLKDQERFAMDQARAAGKDAPAKNSWLASHPSNDQRLQQISQLAAQYQGNYVDEGRARYQQATSGMAFGDSAEQGLIRGQTLLPLIHAEADYRQPLRHGDQVQVQVTIAEIRRRSFAIHYVFLNHHHQIAATARTIHCQINADGSTADDLSPMLRTALTSFQHSAIPL